MRSGKRLAKAHRNQPVVKATKGVQQPRPVALDRRTNRPTPARQGPGHCGRIGDERQGCNRGSWAHGQGPPEAARPHPGGVACIRVAARANGLRAGPRPGPRRIRRKSNRTPCQPRPRWGLPPAFECQMIRTQPRLWKGSAPAPRKLGPHNGTPESRGISHAVTRSASPVIQRRHAWRLNPAAACASPR